MAKKGGGPQAWESKKIEKLWAKQEHGGKGTRSKGKNSREGGGG